MLKELVRGIYKAIDMKDIELLANDLEEPKERPAFKIFIKPAYSRQNGNVRWTDIDIMILYYCKDYSDYYIELYEMEEELTDRLMAGFRLENGIYVELDELEFESDRDLLAVYTAVRIDTYIDSDEDAELMYELGLDVNKVKRSV